MSYVTAVECIAFKREPCAEIDSCDLQTAIDNAERNVDAFLKTLGVPAVPLTGNDITDEFKKAVVTWVVAETYYGNDFYEQGDTRRINAETMIRRFVKSHEFENVTPTVPTSYAKGYQYTGSELDMVDDFKEPRDV